MPSGKTDIPSIEDNRDGTVSIKYEPKEEGSHELLVKYNGEHVQGMYYISLSGISSGGFASLGVKILWEIPYMVIDHISVVDYVSKNVKIKVFQSIEKV